MLEEQGVGALRLGIRVAELRKRYGEHGTVVLEMFPCVRWIENYSLDSQKAARQVLTLPRICGSYLSEWHCILAKMVGASANRRESRDDVLDALLFRLSNRSRDRLMRVYSVQRKCSRVREQVGTLDANWVSVVKCTLGERNSRSKEKI
jgi:hypothetical protein